MISSTFQNNTFIEGMDADTDISILSDKRYRYAENVRVVTNDEGTSGVLQGIEDLEKYDWSISKQETIIGTTTVSQYIIIITVDWSGVNRVYRVSVLSNKKPVTTVILQGYLGLCRDLLKTPRLSVVSNYESDDVMKIYFTDGNSAVKCLNVSPSYDRYVAGSDLVDSLGNILNPSALDITPGCNIPPFEISGIGIGNLPSGVVQYCYQLFNLRGVETTTSPLSSMIHLTASNTTQESQDYMGSYPEDSSGKSITLETKLLTKDFERLRVIRLLYSQNNQPPVISIVNEIAISSAYDTITYVDDGGSFMGTITVDEFNALTGYQFMGATMAKMQNRLFIADITEETWDPGDYDARAYRCNPSGQTVLRSSDASQTLNFSLDTYDLSSIPKEHDCINPYNSMEFCQTTASEQYEYGIEEGTDGNRLLGGHGINIDYCFITVGLQQINQQKDLSEEAPLLDHDCSMNVSPVNLPTLYARPVGKTNKLVEINLGDPSSSKRLPNYADPVIASKCKSYQRDEIYRFGIIFYNSKGLPSPVYWIGDIKFPHASQSKPFTYSIGDLYASAIGLQFKVKNLPREAIAYEIVRCDRTENDRTVIMQAVGSHLYEYCIQENASFANTGSQLASSVEMRPTPLFSNLVGHYAYKGGINKDSIFGFLGTDGIYVDIVQDHVENYMRLVSPEICLQKENAEAIVKNSTYLDYIGVYMSPIAERESPEGMGETYITASASKLNDPTQTGIVSRQYLAYVRRGRSTEGAANDLLMYVTVNPDHYGANVAYSAEISKYFISDYGYHSVNTPEMPTTIEDCVYPPDIPYNVLNDINPYRVNIGERTYTNCAMTEFYVNNHSSLFGPAGPCLIIKADVESVFSGFNAPLLDYDALYTFNAIPVFNIKRKADSAYGGNTYVARQNSIYISIGAYTSIEDANSYTNNVFGGDTFLGILDYPNMFVFQPANIMDYWDRRRYMGSYIPFESSINLNLMNGDMPHMTYTSDNFIDNLMQLEPQQTQVAHVQDRPFFEYNSVYSSQEGSKIFVPKSIYAQSNMHVNKRILVSQAKTNNEILDNWTKFRAADYLDVDNQYGGITNLKAFKDKLFYFQDSAVGIASVNERSLITDGNSNQLVLGTGGVLTRFDYVTTVNGTSILNDNSITNSDNVLYWYDQDKNELCAYSGSVTIISKEKNMQSYLNGIDKLRKGVNLSFYNKKYDEIWFVFHDKSLIFNEQLGRFTSFYTFTPKHEVSLSDRVLTVKDWELYSVNKSDVIDITKVSNTSSIKFVVNKDIMYTKTFDNVLIAGEMQDASGNNITTGLIDSILFDTKHQQATVTNPTFDYRENTYRLPMPRQDSNNEDGSLSFPARLKGKCLICDYHFNSGNEDSFKIPFITTTYRYSLI